MELKKILWPTDLSANAAKALPYVTSLSKKYDAEIHIIYVIQEMAQHEPWYGEFDRNHLDKIQAWEKESAEKHLEQICEKYLQGCPLFVQHTASGDPAQEVINLVKRENIDIVVLAVKGWKGSFPFGSVAEKVVKNSSVPVITIPVNGTN
jgi:nucleotide-binding universal stress UspA family protein